MSRSLQRASAGPLVARPRRTYELAMPPEGAMELLRAPSNPAILSPEQARLAPGSVPFTVLDERGFTIFKPWRFHGPAPESGEEIAVGPAVVGRLTATPRGSRLEVHVRRYAPVPAQRFRFGALSVGGSALFLGMLAAVGPHPIVLGVSAVTALGILSSVLFYRHEQRQRDIRELLAIVERTFGPLELPSHEDAPHRRDDPTGGDT